MELNYSYITDQRTFNRFLPEMLELSYWVFDTETTGLDAHVNKVILLQLGNKKRQFVINPANVDIRALTAKLEDESFIKWGHNILFDYKMMKGTFDITMEGLRDTMVADRIFTAGLNNFQYGLADLCKKHLNIEVDKKLQTSFIGHEGEFSEKQLEYAALDCVYPDMVREKLMWYLKNLKLLKTFEIECNAIPSFGDIEYYGMLLDKDLWEENVLEARSRKEAAFEIFMQEATPHVDCDLNGNPQINPNSSLQVLHLFERLYPGEMVNQKKKPSVDSDTLEVLLVKHPDCTLAKSLLEYRTHAKHETTYGSGYTDAIHPVTGRVHPRIDQLGTDTGRPSGRSPNMLNLPKDQKYRSPWIVGPGRKMITCDYSACELRILASHSKDPVMCKGFNAGVDYHNYTAAEFMTDDKGEKIAYEDVTKPIRGVAKTINFGLTYGMGLTKFAYTIGESIEKAKVYFKSFKQTFYVAMDYLTKIKQIALKPRRGWNIGYSETLLGRKRFFRIPKTPELLKKMFYAEGDSWTSEDGEKFDHNPLNPWDEKLPEPLQKFYGNVASIKRQGGNAVIQGGNADITKMAMHLIRRDIRQYEKTHNGGKYVAHVALQVYDELLTDCPAELADMFAEIVQRRMIEAGRYVITEVPVLVECQINDYWVK